MRQQNIFSTIFVYPFIQYAKQNILFSNCGGITDK